MDDFTGSNHKEIIQKASKIDPKSVKKSRLRRGCVFEAFWGDPLAPGRGVRNEF